MVFGWPECPFHQNGGIPIPLHFNKPNEWNGFLSIPFHSTKHDLYETRDVNCNKHDLEYNSHYMGDISQHESYNLMNKCKTQINNLFGLLNY